MPPLPMKAFAMFLCSSSSRRRAARAAWAASLAAVVLGVAALAVALALLGARRWSARTAPTENCA